MLSLPAGALRVGLPKHLERNVMLSLPKHLAEEEGILD